MPKKPRPATESQIALIKKLGGSPERGMTIKHASSIISGLIEDQKQRHSDSFNEGTDDICEKPPTVRQLMVLRFWGESFRARQSRHEISQWLDEWYMEDSRRLAAWELWKHENADDGSQSSRLLKKIRTGEGFEYINRVPLPTACNSESQVGGTAPKGSNVGCLLLLALIVGMALIILRFG